MFALGFLTLLAAPTATHPVTCGPGADDAVSETVTSEGLRIWSFPDDGGERFMMMVLVGSGSRHEDPASSGVAHLLEHVVLTSSESQSKKQSTEAIRAFNGQFNGWTNHDLTTYYVFSSPSSWELSVQWLADHVVHPALSAEDLAAEQSIVYEELDSRQPHAGVMTFEELLYPGSALGKNIGGNQAGIEDLSTADLRDFYDAHYRAPNMAVGFAGSVPADEVIAAIEAAFADLPRKGGPSNFDPVTPRSTRVGRSDYGGAALDSGWVVTGFHLPAGGAREAAAQLRLEGFLSKRTFDEIREARQLSYDPAVTLRRFTDTVRLDLRVEVSQRKNVGAALEIFDDLIAEAGDPNRLGASSAFTSGRSILRASTTDQLSDSMELAWAMRRAGSSPFDLQAAYVTLSPEELAEYAREHLTRDHQFAISNAPLGIAPPKLIVAALALLLVLGVLDGFRGFPWAKALRSSFDRVRARARRSDRTPRPRERSPKSPSPGLSHPKQRPIQPVSGDELEKSIQDFYADVDENDPPS